MGAKGKTGMRADHHPMSSSEGFDVSGKRKGGMSLSMGATLERIIQGEEKRKERVQKVPAYQGPNLVPF